MSSEVAISVRDLSKAYLIYADPLDRLRQAMIPRLRRFTSPVFRMMGRTAPPRQYFTEYWALRDITFSVKRGESVAIVGRNGSGKSTLLKLVCGTLTSSAGTAQIHGKVAALLELGSGFNPEFTGRENVILNASILGMNTEQIDERLADIIAFAEIGTFIDQPVKTYSTGMAMRLAFAVITHVDADILIVDEALAVGDAYFSQKCMRWLRKFRERGTILFCGHDTGAVMALCDRAIWIENGRMVLEGTAKQICEAYASSIMSQTMGLTPPQKRKSQSITISEADEDSGDRTQASDGKDTSTISPDNQKAHFELPTPPDVESPAVFNMLDESTSFGSGQAEIVEVAMTGVQGDNLSWIEGGENVLITARILVKTDLLAPIAGFIVKDRLGQPLIGDNTFLSYASNPLFCEAEAMLSARFSFRLPYLSSGRYSVTLALASGTLEDHIQHHWLHDALFFDVHSPYKNGVMIAVEMAEISLEPLHFSIPLEK